MRSLRDRAIRQAYVACLTSTTAGLRRKASGEKCPCPRPECRKERDSETMSSSSSSGSYADTVGAGGAMLAAIDVNTVKEMININGATKATIAPTSLRKQQIKRGSPAAEEIQTEELLTPPPSLSPSPSASTMQVEEAVMMEQEEPVARLLLPTEPIPQPRPPVQRMELKRKCPFPVQSPVSTRGDMTGEHLYDLMKRAGGDDEDSDDEAGSEIGVEGEGGSGGGGETESEAKVKPPKKKRIRIYKNKYKRKWGLEKLENGMIKIKFKKKKSRQALREMAELPLEEEEESEEEEEEEEEEEGSE